MVKVTAASTSSGGNGSRGGAGTADETTSPKKKVKKAKVVSSDSNRDGVKINSKMNLIAPAPAPAPLYSPLALPLSSSTSQSQSPSVATSTDSLNFSPSSGHQQVSNINSDTSHVLTNVTRHHGQITLLSPQNMGSRRSTTASQDGEIAADVKGKAKAFISPSELVANAQSHRRDIIDAVRNAGLFPASNAIPDPIPGDTAVRPSIQHQESSSSSFLRVPAIIPANTSLSYSGDPLGRSLSGGTSASSTSLPTTIASSASASTRGQQEVPKLPEQIVVKKKKKKDRKPIDGPSLPITSQTIVGSSSGNASRTGIPQRSTTPKSAASSSKRRAPSVQRPLPADTAAARVTERRSESRHLPVLQNNAQGSGEAVSGPVDSVHQFVNESGPLPPAWSAPLTTITLAFTPMHAYIADFDPEESVQHPRLQLPSIPSSPPPSFRSRPPTPEEQTQVQEASTEENGDIWPAVDTSALAILERGYNSSENESDLVDTQGRGRYSFHGNNMLNSNTAEQRLWSVRHWEAWRRQGIDIAERWRRIAEIGKCIDLQDEDEVVTRLLEVATQESAFLPVSEQPDNAGPSKLVQAPFKTREVPKSSPDASVNGLRLYESAPAEVEESNTARPALTPALDITSSPIPPTTSPSWPMQSPSMSSGEQKSFPGIGTVRRARLKRFEAQRRESKMLSSVIDTPQHAPEPSTSSLNHVNHASVSATPEAETRSPIPNLFTRSPNVFSTDESSLNLGPEDAMTGPFRREGITSGLDKLEAILRRKGTSPIEPSSTKSPPSNVISRATLPEDQINGDRRSESENISGRLNYIKSSSATSGEDVKPLIPAMPTSTAHPAIQRSLSLAQRLSLEIDARRTQAATEVRERTETAKEEALNDAQAQNEVRAATIAAAEEINTTPKKVEAAAKTAIPAKSSTISPEIVIHGSNTQILPRSTGIRNQLALQAVAGGAASSEASSRKQSTKPLSRFLRPLVLGGKPTATASTPATSAPSHNLQMPIQNHASEATGAAQPLATLGMSIDPGARLEVEPLPVMTLPRAPPRLTTDPLSTENLRKLSHRTSRVPSALSKAPVSASESSSSDENAGLSSITSAKSDSESDSADDESTTRPPASSLVSYPSGAVPPSFSLSAALASESDREAAAASWKRSEDGRRYSAILSRPLSIKRKPPIPAKRWGGIWDRNSVQDRLPGASSSIMSLESSDELERQQLKASNTLPSSLAGVQEEEMTWETVGRHDMYDAGRRDSTWKVIGRDESPDRLDATLLDMLHVAQDNSPLTTDTNIQFEPKQPQDNLVSERLISFPASSRSSSDPFSASVPPEEPEEATRVLSGSAVSASVGPFADSPLAMSERRPSIGPRQPTLTTVSTLQRSHATRRPASMIRAARKSVSSFDSPGLPVPSTNEASKASLNTRPRHVYSSSVPNAATTASSTQYSAPQTPPRPKRPLPIQPINEDGVAVEHDQRPLTASDVAAQLGVTASAPPILAAGQSSEVTDLDLLLASLDENASTASSQVLNEVLGLTRSATAEEIDSLPVGRVELERRRLDKNGKMKQKLSCVGINCNKCNICLIQFKEDELACVLPLCLHVFHADPCIRSFLTTNNRCPSCQTPLL